MPLRPGRGPRWWRGKRTYVIGPALVGLIFCVLAILGYRLNAHNYSAFSAHSATTTAIIERIYDGQQVSTTGGPPWTSEYATVRYSVHHRTVSADVELVPQCNGSCLPVFRAGDQIRLAYDTRRVSHAVFPVPRHRLSSNPLAWNTLVLFAALIGVGGLIVAGLNMALGT
jgi:uncharacterized protein DUF3592